MLSKTIIDYIDTLPERVSRKSALAKKIAKEYELYAKKEDVLLSDAAALYCLGTQFVSERVLEKPDKLTETEHSVVNLIPFFSYQIIKNDESIDANTKLMCLYYHNSESAFIRAGLKEHIIPPITEVVNERKNELYTIDAFIGMTSKRAYRDALPIPKALQILKEDEQANEEVLEFLTKFYG